MSSIYKSSFISFSEEPTLIETVAKDNPKIINNNLDIKEQQELIINEEKVKVFYEQAKLDGYNEGYIKGLAYGQKEGYKKGYEEGIIKGIKEANNKAEVELNKNLKLQEESFENKTKLLEEKYNNKILEIEPKMVSIINRLVNKLVGIDDLNPDIILHLVRQGFKEVDRATDITIKVSDEDYNRLKENIQKMTKDLSNKVEIEVLREKDLTKNKCIIETDFGTIDASLDTQLANFNREMKVLIETMEDE